MSYIGIVFLNFFDDAKEKIFFIYGRWIFIYQCNYTVESSSLPHCEVYSIKPCSDVYQLNYNILAL